MTFGGISGIYSPGVSVRPDGASVLV